VGSEHPESGSGLTGSGGPLLHRIRACPPRRAAPNTDPHPDQDRLLRPIVIKAPPAPANGDDDEAYRKPIDCCGPARPPDQAEPQPQRAVEYLPARIVTELVRDVRSKLATAILPRGIGEHRSTRVTDWMQRIASPRRTAHWKVALRCGVDGPQQRAQPLGSGTGIGRWQERRPAGRGVHVPRRGGSNEAGLRVPSAPLRAAVVGPGARTANVSASWTPGTDSTNCAAYGTPASNRISTGSQTAATDGTTRLRRCSRSSTPLCQGRVRQPDVSASL